MAENSRDELARTIRRLRADRADSKAIADAVLASPVIASLQAEAWNEGYHAGHVHAQNRRVWH